MACEREYDKKFYPSGEVVILGWFDEFSIRIIFLVMNTVEAIESQDKSYKRCYNSCHDA